MTPVCREPMASRRPLLLVAAALLLSSLAVPLSAADTADTDTEGLKTVPVDLASGAVQSVLPFDEPFLLTGTAPQGVDRVAAQWCYVEDQKMMSAVLDQVREKGLLTECAPGDAPHTIGPRVLSGDKFSLFVADRLEVNRNVVFIFYLQSPLDATTLAGFKTQVRSALNQTFQNIPEETQSLGRAEYERLQASVNSVLRAQPGVAGQPLQPARGSIFDPDSLSADASQAPPWSDLFDTVYGAQIQRQPILRAIDGAQSALNTSLGNVAAAPQLASLRTAVLSLTGAQRQDLEPVLTADAVAALDTLAAAGRRQIAIIAQGAAPLAGTGAAVDPDETADQIWDPAGAGARVTNLAATAKALGDLSDLCRTAGQVQSLKTALGDAVNGLPDLRQLVDRAAADTEKELNTFQRLQRVLIERSAALDDLSTFLRREAESNVPLVATSTGGFTTRAKNHISMDFGVLYVDAIDKTLSYTGANFYLRPVNRDVPLRQVGGFLRRFSFLLGVSVSSIQEKQGDRVVLDDLFNARAFVLGAGLRISDAVRFNAGALLFQANDPNPLVDDLTTKARAFFALSFDWNIAPLLGKVGTAFTGQ